MGGDPPIPDTSEIKMEGFGSDDLRSNSEIKSHDEGFPHRRQRKVKESKPGLISC